MKIRIEVGIYGVPTKLNLRAKLLYGKSEQFEKKLFGKEFSLDEGGSVTLPLNYFQQCADHIDKEIDKYNIKD
jgi:hypothetical protein